MIEAEFIRVTARVRPPSTAEDRIVSVRGEKSLCFNPWNPKIFTFDSVFGENVTQAEVFEDIGTRIVDGCVDGYNGTIIAYGQTGSGKTHTMFGPTNVENCLLDSQHRGLMPRACDALFTKVIRTLSDVNRRGEHIPYRDSKLTHILRDSLGGNSRTAVIVNVHPDIGYYSDTISTLQFAADCRKIENRVCANEDLAADTVMAYKSEIARLREELRLVEEKTRSEVGSKMSALQDELKNWKEAAILREKALAKAQIQCDLLNAQLMSQTDQGASTQARSELDQLQRRCESAEASRKALNEKYKNLLEKCNETFFGSPPRHLNLNTTPERGKNAKSAAQRREKRRQSFYVPALGNHDSASLVFRPVLFEENEESGSQLKGDIEHDEDVIEKRRLLLLEMDNNRLSQVVLEKEAALKDICDKQKTQSKQWLEEKMLFVQNESLLSARIEGLQVEKQALLEEVKKLQEQKERLSTSISSCNDEKCRLEQSVKSLRSEKLDLEDKLQGMQNENERLLTELRSKPELETDITKLRLKFNAAQEDNYSLRIRNETVEKECHSDLMSLRRMEDRLCQVLAPLLKTEREKNELMEHCEDLKRQHVGLEEYCAIMNTKFDKEIEWLKKMHADELYCKDKTIELEQNSHEKTRQQFVLYQEAIQEIFDRKLAALQHDYPNKEKHLKLDMNESDQQIVQLQADKELLLTEFSGLEEVKQEAAHKKEELGEATKVI
uniref:Kinesin motor domain-containing protein n=1 Tax=Angiostrongylus cantonensis TaxID=6313 RepID=A0A158P6R2_ANGCA